MEESVFGKIIRRELPADIVYEDEDTLAFLDINPVNRGHTLVVPKKISRNIFDIDDASLEAVMRTVRNIAPSVRDAVGASGVNIQMNNESSAGQVVFHFHVHIVPRFEGDGFKLWPGSAYAEGEAHEIAERIRKAIVSS